MFGRNCWLVGSVYLTIVSQDIGSWLVTLSCFWLGFLQPGLTRPSVAFLFWHLCSLCCFETFRQYCDALGKVELWVSFVIRRKVKWKQKYAAWIGVWESEWYKRNGKAARSSREEWGLSLGGSVGISVMWAEEGGSCKERNRNPEVYPRPTFSRSVPLSASVSEFCIQRHMQDLGGGWTANPSFVGLIGRPSIGKAGHCCRTFQLNLQSEKTISRSLWVNIVLDFK